MGKYILYAWRSDDEGGYSVCKVEDFSPSNNYYPQSGPNAMPSVKVGEFSTKEELYDLLKNEEDIESAIFYTDLLYPKNIEGGN